VTADGASGTLTTSTISEPWIWSASRILLIQIPEPGTFVITGAALLLLARRLKRYAA